MSEQYTIYINDMIKKIAVKYKFCKNGIFRYKSDILDNFTPLEKCNFINGISQINEIIFEKNIISEKNNL